MPNKLSPLESNQRAARIMAARNEILKTKNKTSATLLDELERGAIDGWWILVQKHKLTFSEWSGAMDSAIGLLDTSTSARATA